MQWKAQFPDENLPKFMETTDNSAQRKANTHETLKGYTAETWGNLDYNKKATERRKWRKEFPDETMPDFMQTTGNQSQRTEKLRKTLTDCNEVDWNKLDAPTQRRRRHQWKEQFPNEEMPSFMEGKQADPKTRLLAYTLESWSALNPIQKQNERLQWNRSLVSEQRMPNFMQPMTTEEVIEYANAIRKTEGEQKDFQRFLDYTEDSWKVLTKGTQAKEREKFKNLLSNMGLDGTDDMLLNFMHSAWQPPLQEINDSISIISDRSSKRQRLDEQGGYAISADGGSSFMPNMESTRQQEFFEQRERDARIQVGQRVIKNLLDNNPLFYEIDVFLDNPRSYTENEIDKQLLPEKYTGTERIELRDYWTKYK